MGGEEFTRIYRGGRGRFFRHLFRAVVLASDDFHAFRAAHQDRYSPFFGRGREGRCKNRAAVCRYSVFFHFPVGDRVHVGGLLRVPLPGGLLSAIRGFPICSERVEFPCSGGAVVRRAAAVFYRAAQKVPQKIYRR